MKDGAITVAGEKQSLQDMLYVKNLLMDDIYEKAGELSDRQSTQLTILETTIPAKIDGWAWTLRKGGAIDKEIELWKNRKEVTQNIIQTLQNGKERLKARAYHILDMNHLDRLDGIQFWMKKDISKTSSVDVALVEDEFKKYELPVLNDKQYKLLLNMIAHFNGTLEKDLPFESIYMAIELQEKLSNEKIEKCNVSDLPDGHSAVAIEEKPTVRIYSKR